MEELTWGMSSWKNDYYMRMIIIKIPPRKLLPVSTVKHNDFHGGKMGGE